MKILIVKPPSNFFSKGYYPTSGDRKNSENKTAIYAKKMKIKPNQKRVEKSFLSLKKILKKLGFEIFILDFLKELDTKNCKYHDGVFIRDVGLCFKNYWIKAKFNAKTRQKEANLYAKKINQIFNKKIITLPKNAYLEFGEVYFLETREGSFYFGGLSRANKKGHEFVKNILKPKNYFLIKSKGYHLDTIFTPVVNKKNQLKAIIIADKMVEKKSFENLEKLKDMGIEIIKINNKDSSDIDGLGNFAVNCFVEDGILISGANFTTLKIKEKLKKLNINFYKISLIDFNYAGGSVHCLTNEIF